MMTMIDTTSRISNSTIHTMNPANAPAPTDRTELCQHQSRGVNDNGSRIIQKQNNTLNTLV